MLIQVNTVSVKPDTTINESSTLNTDTIVNSVSLTDSDLTVIKDEEIPDGTIIPRVLSSQQNTSPEMVKFLSHQWSDWITRHNIGEEFITPFWKCLRASGTPGQWSELNHIQVMKALDILTGN